MPTDSTHKRFPWRTRWKVVLLALLFCASVLVGASCLIPHQVVRWEVARLGGTVDTEPTTPAWFRSVFGNRWAGLFEPITYIQVDEGVTDDVLRGAGDIESLRTLSVSGNELSDRGVGYLAGHPGLEVLAIGSPLLTDHGLAAIGSTRNLEQLHLLGGKFSDAGLRHLAKLNRLFMLTVRGESVGTATGSISGLPKLRLLDLDDACLGDEGVAELSGMTGLLLLSLRHTEITDASAEHIATMRGLGFLYLEGTAIGDEFLVEISSLPRLYALELSGTNVSADGVKALSTLPMLESLDISGTRISQRELEEIRASLPRCGIKMDAGLPPATTSSSIRSRERPEDITPAPPSTH